MFRKFFNLKFGYVQVEELFKAIFILGLMPIILYGIVSIFFADTGLAGLTHMLSYRGSSGVTFGLGLLVSGLITVFMILVAIVMWKLICELLFLVFRSLEVFIKKDDY
ncbi:MAG TPA: hypothetical protein VIK78_04210 [Ruminiclostridium sp.]